MREILFRGKPKSEADYQLFSQNWKNNCIDGFVYGSLIVSESKYYICVSILCSVNSLINNGVTTIIEVDPETVGQYTGLTDKNGKKIFEVDIVKQTFEKTIAIASDDIWDYDEYADLYGEDVGCVVILPSKGACIKNPIIRREVDGEIKQDGEIAKMYKNICSGRCEVIGNIPDNPELLEVSGDE